MQALAPQQTHFACFLACVFTSLMQKAPLPPGPAAMENGNAPFVRDALYISMDEKKTLSLPASGNFLTVFGNTFKSINSSRSNVLTLDRANFQEQTSVGLQIYPDRLEPPRHRRPVRVRWLADMNSRFLWQATGAAL